MQSCAMRDLNEEEYPILSDLELIRQIQDNCNHEWEGPIYDPEPREIILFQTYRDGLGQKHLKEIPTGQTELVERWKFRCSKCNRVLYTRNKDDIVSSIRTR